MWGANYGLFTASVLRLVRGPRSSAGRPVQGARGGPGNTLRLPAIRRGSTSLEGRVSPDDEGNAETDQNGPKRSFMIYYEQAVEQSLRPQRPCVRLPDGPFAENPVQKTCAATRQATGRPCHPMYPCRLMYP